MLVGSPTEAFSHAAGVVQGIPLSHTSMHTKTITMGLASGGFRAFRWGYPFTQASRFSTVEDHKGYLRFLELVAAHRR